MDVKEQIKQGKLVCPQTYQPLTIEDKYLVTKDGELRYPFINGTPILIRKEDQEAYLSEDEGAMARAYEAYEQKGQKLPLQHRLVYQLDKLGTLGGDHRSTASRMAYQDILQRQGANDVFLSVGGGPKRLHPKLTNLNIGLFPNVDVVGDAYRLPYDTGSVSAIYCDAVLEHLEFPGKAVQEMFRVLESGGEVFATTPFMQPYHGFPNHFQNFTLSGHQRLFTNKGFETVSAGVCVGPNYAVMEILAIYSQYLPTRVLTMLAPRLVRLFALLIKPLDRYVNDNHSAAYILASTTYVHARKPN